MLVSWWWWARRASAGARRGEADSKQLADPALGRGQLLGGGGHSQAGRGRGWQACAEAGGSGKFVLFGQRGWERGERSWKCGGGWKLGLVGGVRGGEGRLLVVGLGGLRLWTGQVFGGCGLGQGAAPVGPGCA